MILLIAIGVFFTLCVLTALGYRLMTADRRQIAVRLERIMAAQDQQVAAQAPETPGGVRAFLRRLGRYAESPRWGRAVEHRLMRAGLPLRSGEFVVLCLGAALPGALLMLLLGASLPLAAVGAALAGSLPWLLLRIRTQRRMKLFNRQLGDSLTLTANSLRTGYSFLQAMELVAREMQAPIADEFARTVKEMSLGATMETALENMAKRLDSDDLDLVLTAVLIQRQVGGNLSEVLDNIARTIRERVRIRGEIRTLTAQGRISGLIVSLLPLVMGGVIYLMNPEYIRPLFAQPAGRLMLGGAVVSQLIGIILIRRIVDIEI